MISRIKKKIKPGPKPAIALLTDFKADSPFPGIIKGVIASVSARLKIIDLCHSIEPGNITEAAFVLRHSYSFFPEKTIFCVVVDPGVGSSRKPVLVRTAHYCFVGPDNGVLSPAVYADGVREIIELTNRDLFLSPVSATFQGRDVFAPVSAYLAKGHDRADFGRPLSHIKKISLPKLKREKEILKASVVYIDSFGNLVTNIEAKVLDRFLSGKNFSAVLKRKKISGLYLSYTAAEEQTPFFIEGSFGFLEVSLKNKNAADFFQAAKGDEILIKRSKR